MFRKFRHPTSFESVYLDFIQFFTVKCSTVVNSGSLRFPVKSLTIKVSTSNIDWVAPLSIHFQSSSTLCTTDFWNQKSIKSLLSDCWNDFSFPCCCCAQPKPKRKTFPTSRRLGWSYRLSTPMELQSFLPVKHCLEMCGTQTKINFQTVKSNMLLVQSIPFPQNLFCGASNFGTWPIHRGNAKTVINYKNPWSLLAYSTEQNAVEIQWAQLPQEI